MKKLGFAVSWIAFAIPLVLVADPLEFDTKHRELDAASKSNAITQDAIRNARENSKERTNTLNADVSDDQPQALCDPNPIPSEPIGPSDVRSWARFGDNFDVVSWRYPCDNDDSWVILTIKPTDGDIPFICSSQMILIQNGIQNDDFKITQDPLGNDSSQCGDVVVDTSFAIKRYSFATDNIELNEEFDVFFDLGDNTQKFTMFAYDPSAYFDNVDPILSNDKGISGLFYDPSNSGHGLDINKHAEGLIVYYYGHTEAGERLWLISETDQRNLDFNSEIRLEMYEITSGTFGHPILDVTTWGSLYLEFNDCDTGHAALSGYDGILEFDFARLTGMEGVGCQ